jgi:hypothetical protein
LGVREEEKMTEKTAYIHPGDEVHYAPISGNIAVKRGDNFVPGKSWTDHHALMREFLTKREQNEVVLSRTVTYGHAFFHGHSGRVDIYVSPTTN